MPIRNNTSVFVNDLKCTETLADLKNAQKRRKMHKKPNRSQKP